ncbi:MAG: hypothetical protein ACTIDT_00840 [Halomonas sp.]|uniref:hypothetical protein n=1 Tax=unclassified Halomonas TaxID=2609666 RepID=UPI003FB65E5F
MPPVTERTVDWLFNALSKLYGSHWRRRCAENGWGQQVEGEWACFDSSGDWLGALGHLSTVHIQCGLMTLNERAEEAVSQGNTAFPPDSPVLFAKICRLRPEPLRLPSLEAAWKNVQERAFSGKPYVHPGVAAAALHVDMTAMRSASYAQLERHRKTFEHYYASSNRECVVERAARGETLRPLAAIESDDRLTPASLAERASLEAAQAKAYADFGGSMTADQGMAMMRGLLRGSAVS